MSSNVKDTVLDLQKQLLSLQRSAASNTFEMMSSLQEQQQKLAQSFVDRSPLAPEAKEAYEAWVESLTSARDQFRSASEKNFELLETYLERVGSPKEQE